MSFTKAASKNEQLLKSDVDFVSSQVKGEISQLGCSLTSCPAWCGRLTFICVRAGTRLSYFSSSCFTQLISHLLSTTAVCFCHPALQETSPELEAHSDMTADFTARCDSQSTETCCTWCPPFKHGLSTECSRYLSPHAVLQLRVRSGWADSFRWRSLQVGSETTANKQGFFFSCF